MNCKTFRLVLAATALAAAALHVRADVVTDWNQKAGELVGEAKLGTPPANRVMAMVQTAVFDAALAASKRVPGALQQDAVAAAVAAANRVTLTKLMPSQEATIQAAYGAALAAIADSPAKSAGIAAGEEAAAALLAARLDDGAASPEKYKPHTTAGAYVPTATPAVPTWPQRRTWVLKSASQLRPAAPPALNSATWARDFNEVKALGGKTSTRRTLEQIEIARFWDYSLPAIYHGVVRSVALQPGRDVLRNARLYAAVTQAMDDAMIAVFDAKYTYNFWRPSTAIRNAEIDGNEATEPDATWASMIDTPMHPEYPSAHSILAGAVGAVLKAELAGQPTPELSTTSPTAKGVTRRWNRIDDFVREVSVARIYEGVHFRFSTDVGSAMGQQIGEATAAKHLPQP
ncbi:MAG: vanadium-dependent haloperoxidase [Burkholderiaceae bacterium]|nr:vanadium-dependent haloperoxidase [Burkholderiaceae bacterium]